MITKTHKESCLGSLIIALMNNFIINISMKRIIGVGRKTILFVILLFMPIAVNAERVEIDGINYELNESDSTASVAYRKNKYTGDIVIPPSIVYNEITYDVTSIRVEAFKKCYGLKSVSIPNSVTSFESEAFLSCTGLTDIIIPNSVISIGAYAFQGCTGLKSISIPNSVTTIYGCAFKDCTGLTNISISNSVISIGGDAFQNCTGLPVIENIRYADTYAIDVVDKTLTTYNIKEGTRFIGNNAFRGCTELTSIKLPNSVTTMGNNAFQDCTALTRITIPDDVRRIGEWAFTDCKKLQSFTIPKKVETIETMCFFGCERLSSIVIPNNVNMIEQKAFMNCYNLSDIKIENGITTLSLGIDAFASVSPTYIYLGRNIYTSSLLSDLFASFDLTVSKTVTKLAGTLFAKNNHLKSITFEEGPDSLVLEDTGYNSSTSSLPFNYCSIDSIYLGRVVYGTNHYYQSSKLFSQTKTSFSVRIGDNIKEIGDGDFSWWKIDSLYIPKTVEKIGSSPFQNCSYLNNVFIEDGEDTLEFSEGIGFYSCQLRNLYLGRNISYPQGCSPFSRNKEGLKSLTIGNCVTEISESQFAGCVNLNQLAFPASLKRIGKQAFYGCDGLDTLNIPANITEIRTDAFNLCRGLTFVNLEDCEEPLTIDNNFMNCELKKVYLGRNINYPEHFSPFSGLDYLDSLVIGSNVTAIGNTAFTDCRNLKDVVSYSAVVPETDQHAFTQSYLPSASLLVPYKLYDQYSTTTPWSLFGRIKNFESLYNLTYLVDDVEHKKYVVEQGAVIEAEDEPTKEGYTFSGWSEIPETMPDHDVTVTGTFSINSYKLTYMIDDKVYKETMYEYGATITPELQPEGDYATFEWRDLPETMPAHDVVVHASYTSGIVELMMNKQQDVRIYSPNGNRLNAPQKGLNIIRMNDSKSKKVIIR